MGTSALKMITPLRRFSRRFQACEGIAALSSPSQLCFITQSCGFRDAYPQIEEKNAVVLGVSPDGQKSHQKFKTKFNLPFTLLVDDEHKVAEAYGVWGEKSMMGKKYMGIIRSHFVIDEEGKIAQAEVKVNPVDSVERALSALG